MKEIKIVLLGYMGCGKSTVGKILANHLNVKFLDLDTYIEQKENGNVKTIFKEKGELYFRKKENAYVQEILSTENQFVLSLGGGTPCFGNNMSLIHEHTQNSFYINTPIVELVRRLQTEKEHRPLLRHLKNEELHDFIAKHMFERSYFYNQAVYKIKADDKSATAIAEIIVATLV